MICVNPHIYFPTYTFSPLCIFTGKYTQPQIHSLWIQSPLSRSRGLQIEKHQFICGSSVGISQINDTINCLIMATNISIFATHMVTNNNSDKNILIMFFMKGHNDKV